MKSLTSLCLSLSLCRVVCVSDLGAGDTEIDGDGDGGVDSVSESLAQAKLDEQKEQVVVAEAADTLQVSE